MARNDFLTIARLLENLERKPRKRGGKKPTLTASDVSALVEGWKHVRPQNPSTYSPSALYYENFSANEQRTAFDAAQARLGELGVRGALEVEGMHGGIDPAFGLSPRDAVKLILTGRF